MNNVYVGCYTDCIRNKGMVDYICWNECIIPKVYRNRDFMDIDWGEDPDFPNCNFNFVYLEKEMFNLIASVIENKPVDIEKINNKKLLNSSLYFMAIDKTIEIKICDNKEYYIDELLLDGAGEFPMRMFYYVIEGLNKSGYKQKSNGR